MARWKLACNHYIRTVKPTKWRYTETDQSTGETIEKEYDVPRLLDIKDPKCWSKRWGPDAHFMEGEVIVCQPGKGQPGDWEFLGDPTPDMIPLDEEAEAISATYTDRWAYKPEVMDPSAHSQSLVDRADFTPAPVEVAGMTDLVAAMTQMINQQGDLIAALHTGAAAQSKLTLKA